MIDILLGLILSFMTLCLGALCLCLLTLVMLFVIYVVVTVCHKIKQCYYSYKINKLTAELLELR